MHKFQMLSLNEIEQIHETSLRILEEVGVIVCLEKARNILKKHGAKVEGQTVYIPRNMVEEKRKLAPSSFTLYSRNPERNMEFNLENIHYCACGGAPFVSDLERGRRTSTKADFIELVKLYQSLDLIELHHVPCEMSDVDDKVRNKMNVYLMMKYSDKPFMPLMYSYEEAKEIIEMAALPFGGLDAVKNKKPVVVAIPCSTTPLSWDERTLGSLIAFAECGQVQLINSLCMAGATTPVTLAGTAALQNAEILLGIILTQCVNPGAPIIYAASSSVADMKTANLAVGAPETAMLSMINAQIAKYYNLPCRVSGAITDSSYVGAQSGYESAINMMAAEIAGGNFILAGSGVLESYNTVSFEKAVIDHEMLRMFQRIRRGIEVNEDTLAFDLIKKVGPQGEFLTQMHTFKNFKKEHYMPDMSFRGNFDRWVQGGSVKIEEAATARWKDLLANYVQPDFSAELDADLKKYVE